MSNKDLKETHEAKTALPEEDDTRVAILDIFESSQNISSGGMTARVAASRPAALSSDFFGDPDGDPVEIDWIREAKQNANGTVHRPKRHLPKSQAGKILRKTTPSYQRRPFLYY